MTLTAPFHSVRAVEARGGFDAVSFLTVYLVLLCAIPSYLVIPILGSVGRLFILWGLVGVVWWSHVRLQRIVPLDRGATLVKVAAALFFGIAALSYATVSLSGVPSNVSSMMDSSLIRLISWAGVVLVALDGISDRYRMQVLLRRVVLAGSLMATLGIVQFVTGASLVDSLSLPGFAVSDSFDSVQARAGFARAAGTASHPLEYGVLLCAILPLAIALATTDRHRTALARWTPVVMIAAASSLSMSRSAMIGVTVGLGLLFPFLPRLYRIKLLLLGLALGIGMMFLVPGMMGTIRGLFMGIGADSSTLSRAESAEVALDIAFRHPWLGIGYGAFDARELILDNQILLLMIECGVLGLTAFLVLAGCSVVAGWRAAYVSPMIEDRVLAPSLAAGFAAATSTLMFFDGLEFAISSGMIFLFVGLSGAMLRLAHRGKARLEFTRSQLAPA